MAETLADAQRMVAAAAAAGRIYAVSQNRRYASGIRRLRAMLAGLGPLTMINSDFFLGPHFGGFRDRMKHPLLLDMAIHTFDQARFLTGADPLAVYCRSWNPAGSWYDGAASAVCIFEMTGGVVYTYRGSWCAEGCATEWNAEWRLIGERGSAVWDGASEPRAEAVAETGGWLSTLRALEPPPVGDEAADVHPVIAEFVSCVEAGTMPETVCTDNIKSLAMVHAAIESSRCGARVEIEHD